MVINCVALEVVLIKFFNTAAYFLSIMDALLVDLEIFFYYTELIIKTEENIGL